MNTPLTFNPVYKDYIWGGDRLSRQFHRDGTPTPCAESWEISAHPDGASIVAQGKYAGRSLPDLASEFGVALMGTKTPDPTRFPLLFKLIDARDKLSVQVHPNNANAALTHGEPKTEMWCVLDRVQGSSLYAGLCEGTTPELLRAALADGTADKCLTEMKVNPGDAIFIPGGLVHAIGDGCLIYEVQQNSNTTYRLYDWNRVGADGTPRPLHIEESFKTIEWDNGRMRECGNGRMRECGNARMRECTEQTCAEDERPGVKSERSFEASGAGARSGIPRWSGTAEMARYRSLVSCAFFQVGKLVLAGSSFVVHDGTTFTALFVEDGNVSVEAGSETVQLAIGMSCLIPAAAQKFTLSGNASLIITTL
jgi:mannose-6-phosphate isomerase